MKGNKEGYLELVHGLATALKEMENITQQSALSVSKLLYASESMAPPDNIAQFPDAEVSPHPDCRCANSTMLPSFFCCFWMLSTTLRRSPPSPFLCLRPFLQWIWRLQHPHSGHNIGCTRISPSLWTLLRVLSPMSCLATSASHRQASHLMPPRFST